MVLLDFNSGETKVGIQSNTATLYWNRFDGTLNLAHSIQPDQWIHAGGFYRSDGVSFFTDEALSTENSVDSTTGLDLLLFNPLSLSSSRLRLYLLALWNSKIPLSQLKRTTGNFVPVRNSAVLFLQFNFLFNNEYQNWADPSF